MFQSRHFSAFAITLMLSTTLHALPASAQYEYDEEPTINEQPIRRPVNNGTSTTSAARLQVRINELEEQVRKLQGALEQVSFSNKQLKTQIEKIKGDIDYRLTELEKGAPSTAAAPAEQSTGEQPSTANKTASTSFKNEEPQESPKSQSVENAKVAVPKFETSSEHYSFAFKLMNQAKYAEAGNAFDAFTQRYAKDPLIGNSFYWLGETYYVRKDYVKAADSFRQGYEAMPTGPKASDNLLKLAMALGATGKEKESCIVLKQVVSKFGKTSANVKSRAEQEMNRLDCR